jgi:regulatory protein
MPRQSAYLDALHMLARRELSVAGVRARLTDREHPADEIEAAITHLLENRALDDGRVARAFVRTAVTVKGRGRLRVARELQAIGIERDVAAEALGEVFGDIDERALVARALKKKLRGAPRALDRAERGRLYQFLMRQGFSPGVVADTIRKLGGTPDSIE